MADVVSVQRVSRDTVGHQVLLQGERDGGFTGSGETCERGPRGEVGVNDMRVVGSGGNGGCRVLVGM